MAPYDFCETFLEWSKGKGHRSRSNVIKCKLSDISLMQFDPCMSYLVSMSITISTRLRHYWHIFKFTPKLEKLEKINDVSASRQGQRQ